MASGVVSSIGTDKEHGVYIVIRYGKYEVTYAHLANIFIRFGQKGKSRSDGSHQWKRPSMEVAFDGEELNPIEFLTMLLRQYPGTRQIGTRCGTRVHPFDGEIKTRYDRDKEEIEELMPASFPSIWKTCSVASTSYPNIQNSPCVMCSPWGATKNYFL